MRERKTSRRERRPRRQVSQGRKNLHRLGLVLMGIGLAGGLVCFIGFMRAGFSEVDGGAGPHPLVFWIGFTVGIVMFVLGQTMRLVAQRGMAGSGLVLDPERARDDLEPWARAAGDLVGDAVDESGLLDETDGTGADGRVAVKVRCGGCRALNDENAKFCNQCGAPV